MDLSKYPEYETIPFEIPDLNKAVKTTSSKPITIVDNESGEVIVGTQAGQQRMVVRDQSPYVKAFPNGIDLLAKLSTKGTTILSYILKRLKPGQVEIELRVSRLQKVHRNLLGGRFYEGMDELLKYGYIVKKKGGKAIFFLNPNFFFNGDRKWLKQDE